MVENCKRPHNAENHVDTKPVSNLAQKLQNAEALAQRIQQQNQDKQGPDNAERVSETVLGKQATSFPALIADDYRGRRQAKSGKSTPILVEPAPKR